MQEVCRNEATNLTSKNEEIDMSKYSIEIKREGENATALPMEIEVDNDCIHFVYGKDRHMGLHLVEAGSVIGECILHNMMAHGCMD